jgi:hypothetical protein
MDFGLIVFAAYSAFVVWVIGLGGANVLEGTIKSTFVVHPSAIWWSSTTIRIYVGIVWAGAVLSWLL